MELKTKFRILSWAMVLLLFLNITAFFMFFYKTKINPPDLHPKDFPIPIGPEHPKPPIDGAFFDFLNEKLNLTEEQQIQFKELRIDFKDRSKIYFDSIHYYNEKLDQLMSCRMSDSTNLENYCDKIGHFHSQLKQNFVVYYFDIYEILDENQKAKLHDIFMEFKHSCKNNHKNNNNNDCKNHQNK